MKGKEYLERVLALSDRYFEQLVAWYRDEKEVMMVPDGTLEAYLGMIATLYQTYNYEMEQLDIWYAEEFDRIKFQEEKPLSDKSVDVKIKLTDKGKRIIILERRLKTLKFTKEALSKALQARIEQKRDVRGMT